MIRVLHIVGSMSPSGIGNFLMNVYRNIDREKIQFDFIVHEKRSVSFDEEIKVMGGRLFYVTLKSDSLFKNLNDIRKIVKREKYRMVFRHTDTAMIALDLLSCKLGGAKYRIPHSHSTSTGNKRVHNLMRPLLNMLSTERFACSTDAGKWMYGNKKYRVIMNGIDINAFAFSKEKRDTLRKQLGWEDKFVIGHVGNFMKVKNHRFMIALLAEIKTKISNARLAFVGSGDLYDEIIAQISEHQLEDDIDLLGVRNDTNELLSAMDLFIFPSLYEGMPIALVEAQTAGLPCVVSDVITDDVIFTSEVSKLPLESKEKWISKVVSVRNCVSMTEREADREKIAGLAKKKGFCVKDLGKRYEKFILNKFKDK